MLVSEITRQHIVDYLRLSELTESDQQMIDALLVASKNFIISYTGRKEEELDQFPDFSIVVFILCQDMWDHRTLYVDKTNLNKVVDTILGMHSVNLL